MKTMQSTTVQDGYYISFGKRFNATCEGGQEKWEDFVDFVQSEVGDGKKAFLWHVKNGFAHVLSVKASSICNN